MKNGFATDRFTRGFLVILALAIGGAGYYLSIGYGKYKGAANALAEERERLESFGRKGTYPSEENAAIVRAEIDAYQKSVRALKAELRKFQRPLSPISNTEFPNFVKLRTESFRMIAEETGLRLPDEFYLGFPEYRSRFPRPADAGLLHFQAQAMEALLMKLASAQVNALVQLERDPLPVAAPNFGLSVGTPVLENYPLRLTIRGRHESIREFINSVSNDPDYFFRIRLMRIENSAQDGPAASTQTVPAVDLNHFYDAKVILGAEEIQTHLVIDLVRFREVQ